MKEEVYCKGCRYFSWGSFCDHPSNVSRDYKGEHEWKSEPSTLNRATNCSNYQKKKTLKEILWSFVSKFV